MEIDGSAFFRRCYPLLAGHSQTFPWQEELFRRLCDGRIPPVVDLPTGCGKTSAMAVWLIALAHRAGLAPTDLCLPRRLIWVVNRRAVVDQATNEAASLRVRLRELAASGLREMDAALRALCVDREGEILAISTLRGEFADNAEWRNDPSRASIVVGTVDMIGSRLLFSGYGRGFKSRPLHAGFLGQDSLVVHDEAHLEPAFQELITAVRAEQERCADYRPMRVMALTATSRDHESDGLGLTLKDKADGEIRMRIEARKGVAFHEVESPKHVAGTVASIASGFAASGKAILIYLRRVDDVREVATALRKKNLSVQELTGTLRGLERDSLVRQDEIFARFLRGTNSGTTAYLVCTAAGEVGIDMSADHLICDLTPLDSMTQRFGRLNRRGRGDAQIEIVYDSAGTGAAKTEVAPEFGVACRRTLELLHLLPIREDGRKDASPLALSALPVADRVAAFTPTPEIVPTTEILFDAWAMTTVRKSLPGRPPVADWLHGIEKSPPETSIAWRQEVQELSGEILTLHPPDVLLDDYPVKPHELLRDSTARVAKHVACIAERDPELPVWVIDGCGDVRVGKVSDLRAEDDSRGGDLSLANRTLLLPPKAGGLTQGMLDGSAPYDDWRVDYDVADRWYGEDGQLRRKRSWDERIPGMRLVRAIEVSIEGSEEEDDIRRQWFWQVGAKTADDDGSGNAPQEQTWSVHTTLAERAAEALVTRLGLGESERRAVVLAARWHDLGKKREAWQRSIGNLAYPSVALAKSNHHSNFGRSPYRHELGSALDAVATDECRVLEDKERDLALHLVAAHHGRARPHFPEDEIFDPEQCHDACREFALQTPSRFARLQKQYGRWGLAYLESLLRAADILASQKYVDSAHTAEAGI